jgi:glyoxylase-like metal-dependent hydrolase (beta-lactamase superfamily II)
LERVHTIVVTHSRPDHFGGAGLLAQESRGAIVASDRFHTFFDPDDMDDRELEAADDIDPDESPIPSLRIERPAPWGGSTVGPPREARAKMLAHQADFFKWFKPPRPSHRVADCDHVDLGARDWVRAFYPGAHRRSSLSLRRRARSVAGWRPGASHDHTAHFRADPW